MNKADTASLKELIEKTQKDCQVVTPRPTRTALTARGLLDGMKMICDENPDCYACPLARMSNCARPDPEAIDIVSNYLDNKYFGGEE